MAFSPFFYLFIYFLFICAWNKSTIAKLEMSRKEADAVKILEKAYQKAMNEGQPHEAYEIEILLVEMLIYKVYKWQLASKLALIFPLLGVQNFIYMQNKSNKLWYVCIQVLFL